MNLKYSVINIAGDIIKILNKQKIIEYTALLNKLQLKYGEDVKYNYVPSLNLVYLFGKIKYYPKEDVFERITK